MNESTRQYLAEIGRRGGRSSRRKLSPQQARAMVKVREAKRLYRRYHAMCFWSHDRNLQITKHDVQWVADTLRQNGTREAWLAGASLCR